MKRTTNRFDSILSNLKKNKDFKIRWIRNAARREIINSIIRLRIDNGMTQQELANKTGLTQATIANLENNIKDPRLDTLLKLADAFGVELKFVNKR